MRKLALAIVLVLVLVGGAVGGMGVVTSANGGPTLDVHGNSAPGSILIIGSHWTPGVPVNLWMDTKDDAHHVAVATPNTVGGFSAIFLVGPTILGPHHIIGKQGANPDVVAQFTPTSTQQLDDRIWDVLNGMGIEVATIENKLDGIQDDIGVFRSDSGYRHWTSGDETITINYAEIRHVSLTFGVSEGNDNDWVKVEVCFSSPEPDVWGTLDTIGGTGLWGGNANGMHIYEFDTDAWRIVGHVGSSPLNCAWIVTTTAAYYD